MDKINIKNLVKLSKNNFNLVNETESILIKVNNQKAKYDNIHKQLNEMESKLNNITSNKVINKK
jgi:tetrahydromethanopterin S-methyltransferase subunit G